MPSKGTPPVLKVPDKLRAQETEAFNCLLDTLKALDAEQQQRLLKAACILLNINFTTSEIH
jgi:hypothetical protein